jgi:hypothetical protein
MSGDDTPVAPHADDDSKLDELIDSVTETITNRDTSGGERDEILLDTPVNDVDSDTWRAFKANLDDPETASERGLVSELDGALKAAVDRRASQETESADFRQSREWREALDKRYDGRVAIGDLLEAFAHWHERLKENPRGRRRHGLRLSREQAPYALPDDAERASKPGTPAGVQEANPDQRLNGILAAAIDRHQGKGDGEQQAFAASARHRAALKEMFPGISYAEACRRVVNLDGDLHRDPIGTAARMAATYGLPMIPSQEVGLEQRGASAGDAQQAIAATAERLPDFGGHGGQPRHGLAPSRIRARTGHAAEPAARASHRATGAA